MLIDDVNATVIQICFERATATLLGSVQLARADSTRPGGSR